MDFFNKYDKIYSFLWICSYLKKKSFMENFIFCAVIIYEFYYDNDCYSSVIGIFNFFLLIRFQRKKAVEEKKSTLIL